MEEEEAAGGGKIIYYQGRGTGIRGMKSRTASNKSVIEQLKQLSTECNCTGLKSANDEMGGPK